MQTVCLSNPTPLHMSLIRYAACLVAVGHNSAMAVEDSIPVAGVGYTRFDMG